MKDKTYDQWDAEKLNLPDNISQEEIDKLLRESQDHEDTKRTYSMLVKWLFLGSALLTMPDLVKKGIVSASELQTDISQYHNIDIQDQTFDEFNNKFCSENGENLMKSLPTNKVFDLSIKQETNGKSNSTIFINDKAHGPKVCFDLRKERELLITSVNGQAEEFRKLKGHMMAKNKDNGNFEIMWTESNTGDDGAKQNIIL